MTWRFGTMRSAAAQKHNKVIERQNFGNAGPRSAKSSSSDLSVGDKPAAREGTPELLPTSKQAGTPMHPFSNRSFDTPTTADLSWGSNSPNSTLNSEAVDKNASESEDEFEDNPNPMEMMKETSVPSSIVAPQPHSLASALGMSVDPSEQAPAVRRGDFKPQPTTLEEKRVAKEEAMSRLNRIKAKAIKSANKSLGVDEHHLSAAVGMSMEEYESSTKKKVKKTKQEEAPIEVEETSAEQIQFIADTLGIPVELFGVQPTKKSKSKPVPPPEEPEEVQEEPEEIQKEQA